MADTQRQVVQWFPGHMTKAMRKTEEDVKLCDGIIYVLDARAPFACLNKKLSSIEYCKIMQDLL